MIACADFRIKNLNFEKSGKRIAGDVCYNMPQQKERRECSSPSICNRRKVQKKKGKETMVKGKKIITIMMVAAIAVISITAASAKKASAMMSIAEAKAFAASFNPADYNYKGNHSCNTYLSNDSSNSMYNSKDELIFYSVTGYDIGANNVLIGKETFVCYDIRQEKKVSDMHIEFKAHMPNETSLQTSMDEHWASMDVAVLTGGFTEQMSCSGTYFNEFTLKSKSCKKFDKGIVTWTSSDETVATVDDEGFVTGKGAGKATITASIGDTSASKTVRVIANRQEDIDFYTDDHNRKLLERRENWYYDKRGILTCKIRYKNVSKKIYKDKFRLRCRIMRESDSWEKPYYKGYCKNKRYFKLRLKPRAVKTITIKFKKPKLKHLELTLTNTSGYVGDRTTCYTVEEHK